MIQYLSADYIYPVASAPIKNGVIGVDADGIICFLATADEAKAQGISNITSYSGALVPGFINTHCHLELSHLKAQVPEKTGLINFIKQILAKRQQPDELVLSAMQKADEEMLQNGIVAVGDISNVALSKQVKAISKIYYHTFIEVFGFNKPSVPIIEAGLKLKQFFAPLKASIVPHAPYSVAENLFVAIEQTTQSDDVLSIHNQETAAENELFETKTGDFVNFLNAANLLGEEEPIGQTAIHYHLPNLPKTVNTLMVHNSFTSKADLYFAKQTHPKLYWCLCPNANLYIEDRLPDVDLLRQENVTITLGTDSLASNHQLSILAEMQTLQDYKNVPFEQSLTWATLNGAKFLNIDHQYGSLAVGKKPGLVLVELQKEDKITHHTTIKRLF